MMQRIASPPRSPRKPLDTTTIALVIVLVVVSLLSLVAFIYSSVNPRIVTMTLTSTTVSSFSTTSVSTSMSISTSTLTSTSTLMSTSTVSMTSTQAVPTLVPQNTFNPAAAACQYPLNPGLCNEGPPTTVIGIFENDTSPDGSCLTVLGSVKGAPYLEQTFVIWFDMADYQQHSFNFRHPSTPISIPNGHVVEIYGYIYPDWPPAAPFPPYPFSNVLCVGIPVASIAPYFSTNP